LSPPGRLARSRRPGPRGWAVGVALALAAALPGAAAAHAFWISPSAFWLARPGVVSARLMVGSEFEHDRWGASEGLVARLIQRGPGGQVDARAALRPPGGDADAVVRLSDAGRHLVALETREALQELPADRFDAFAEEEGLRLVVEDRAHRKAGDRPGREAFSRRAKLLVQVGPWSSAAAAVATARVGHTLEIVPERDPLALPPGEPLPVRLYFQGQPLAGATVELISLDVIGGRLTRQVTDAEGRASLSLPRVGSWLVNAIWSTPADRPDADYETIFASLTFGYPRH
jgi:hypothetical protein